jgi:transposase
MAMTIVENHIQITGGVDTHLDFHVAAVIDANGGVLGVETFPTRGASYAQLVAWIGRFGPIERVGVEGTGSYSTGLTRHLRSEGKNTKEAIRALKREISNVIYRALVADARRLDG